MNRPLKHPQNTSLWKITVISKIKKGKKKKREKKENYREKGERVKERNGDRERAQVWNRLHSDHWNK